MRPWDRFLTERDREVLAAAGFARQAGFGQRPAVLVIDVNYAFCGHREEPILISVRTWRNSCGEAAWRAIPHIQRLLQVARSRRIPVFYTTGKDPRPDGFDRGMWTYKNVRSTEDGRLRVPGVSANEIVREVAPLGGEVVIEKLKPSAFHGTPLLGFLVYLQVDTLLVCGCVTSGCVRATVVDAFSYNFRVGVVEEATFDRFEVSHAINLFDMHAKYADVVGAEEAIDYLRSVPVGLYDDKISLTLPQK